MKNKLVYIVIFFVLVGFSAKDYFDIPVSAKDVEIKIPKGFPKPVYDLQKNKITPQGFYLGKKLFFDPILSKNNTISCGDCHQQFAAFAHTDHALSHGIYGLIGKRNAPALQNLIWKDAFMWDGGINHLDLQPITPITSPFEMDETLNGVLAKLRKNEEYKRLFKLTYNDTAITSERFLKAMSQFLATLISADSRYDRYIHHKDTFSVTEKRGLKLFRANCAVCHKEPLFTDNSYRNNGLFWDVMLNDSGRYKITGNINDVFKFKVPSLRNVAASPPYMHDGRFYSLQQVLNHYSKDLSNNKYADSLIKNGIALSEQDKKDVIAFLKTLTDYTFLRNTLFINPNSQFNQTVKPTLSDDDLVSYFESRWNKISLQIVNGTPQYTGYLDSLDKVLSDLKNKNIPKLNDLRNQLQNSQKHKEAVQNCFMNK